MYSTLLYSKSHTTVLTVYAQYMHILYQGVYLVFTFGKQFQVIHKQQVIQFEFLVAPFIASLALFNNHVNGTTHKVNNDGDNYRPEKYIS